MPSSAEIRQQFIDFFVDKAGHTAVKSSPVVPHDDPTLLFANAGMNQFKDVFLGVGERPYTRAVDTQKCIRAGGKHNDLDDVGRDTYHHTFFEMLGNWSFGDYFKTEAIDWAWQLLTDVWGLDPTRLHATYFEGSGVDGLEPDHEARDLWRRYLPEAQVHPGDTRDNFWEMGETGPCGPCSEIHYDRTPDRTGAKLVNADSPDVIEIWNLVFIQFNRGGDGKLSPLPARHVDTGMGFERICAVLQGKASNYDTDVFTPLFDRIREITGARAYGGDLADPIDVAYRVIADHGRCLTFALTDGAAPGNEGRGYVLRRILRRGVRYGRQNLGQAEPFLHKLVPTIVATMGEAFPELRKNPEHVAELIAEEEQSFGRTLDRGIELFDEAAGRAGSGQINAEDAFKLHDTYGFPLDLTQLMAEERGMTVDVAGFEALMETARQTSRATGGAADPRQTLVEYVQQQGPPVTEFIGYEQLVVDGAKVVDRLAVRDGAYVSAERLEEGEPAALVVDRTPFYAEAGGQVGDTGYIRTHTGAVFRVDDTLRYGDVYFHLGELESGNIHKGQPAFGADEKVMLEVDHERRERIMANHTSTHMLNKALRDLVNPEADQRGSLVDADRLRFDFSNSAAVSVEQVEQVEQQVNAQITADEVVYTGYGPQEQALKINGLRAVFGEKYPPTVRIVAIGEPVDKLLAEPDRQQWQGRSIEFCGGTHLQRTGEADRFAVISEEAVAKGIRRITAVTREDARKAFDTAERYAEHLQSLDKLEGEKLEQAVGEASESLGEAMLPLVMRSKLRAGLEALQKKVKQQRKQASKQAAGQVVEQARAIAAAHDAPVIVASVDDADGNALRQAMDVIRRKRPDSALLLGSAADGKVAFIAAVPETMIQQGLKAGDWVREVARVAGGGGGGRPDMAQAGGKDPAKLDEALQTARDFAEKQLIA